MIKVRPVKGYQHAERGSPVTIWTNPVKEEHIHPNEYCVCGRWDQMGIMCVGLFSQKIYILCLRYLGLV